MTAYTPGAILLIRYFDVAPARNLTNEHACRSLRLMAAYAVLHQMDILRSISFNHSINHR